MQLGKTHRYFSKIAYRDLDMYSVLYHPRYFEFADTARNQAFQDFGYPIEEQLKDKVGFTVGGINNVLFKRPIFMAEEITVFTETVSVTPKSCEVLHWITLGKDETEIATGDEKLSKAIFQATFKLVFVSMEDISEFPLNGKNIKNLKAISFNEKVKSKLRF